MILAPRIRRVAGLAAVPVLALAFHATAHAQARNTAPRGPLPLKLAPRPTTAAITPADAMTRVYIVADDSMMGRRAGTPGNVKGTDYIAREARRMGLEPAGDNGTYFQTIPLVQRGIDPASTLTVDGAALTLFTDFSAMPYIPPNLPFGPRFQASGAPVVYGGQVGGTMISPEQAAGKVVVFTTAAGPDGRPRFQFWAGGAMSRYKDAAAIVAATMDVSPPALLGFLRAQQTQLGDGTEPGAGSPMGIIVTSAVAERIMGAPLAGLQPGAAGKPLTANVRWIETPTPAPARNVVALLRGSDPVLRNQYVAIGAHNDHVGTGEPVEHDSLKIFNRMLRPGGAEGQPATATPEQLGRMRTSIDSLRRVYPARVDSIFNGADDDASGTVAVLEIAEQLASLPAARRPKRSILFVWHTAEELGLYGSEHFTDHPTVPLDSIVAQLNIDMVGRGAAGDIEKGGAGYLQLVGSRRLSTQLGDLVESTNTAGRHGFTFDYAWDADGHEANIYCRSDHYNYARYGIPVTFFTTGGHPDYHMLTDEAQYIDYQKLTGVAKFIRDVAVAVADRPDRLTVDKPKPDPKAPCKQ